MELTHTQLVFARTDGASRHKSLLLVIKLPLWKAVCVQAGGRYVTHPHGVVDIATGASIATDMCRPVAYLSYDAMLIAMHDGSKFHTTIIRPSTMEIIANVKGYTVETIPLELRSFPIDVGWNFMVKYTRYDGVFAAWSLGNTYNGIPVPENSHHTPDGYAFGVGKQYYHSFNGNVSTLVANRFRVEHVTMTRHFAA